MAAEPFELHSHTHSQCSTPVFCTTPVCCTAPDCSAHGSHVTSRIWPLAGLR